MKILLSAYACEPGKGSEPEVGFRTMLAAARDHEVWVLTRRNNIPSLERALADHDRRDRIHLVGLDVPGLAYRFKHSGLAALHWYYDLWQRHAGMRGRALDREVGFDVIHHATFATFWTRAGVASVGKPLVWGPVGGGVAPPRRLLSELGVRGCIEDALRISARTLSTARPCVQSTLASVAVALVQNQETADRLSRRCRIVQTLPNAICILGSDFSPPPSLSRTKEIALVGRLIPLKGGLLAIRVLRSVRDRDATLTIYGDGPERQRMLKMATTWGVSNRVRFLGSVPRADLLRHLAVSGVLLHPALHDESPLTVAESLSLGTPVVSLQRGGPATLAALWPKHLAVTVPPEAPGPTARRLAHAVDEFLAAPPPVRQKPLYPSTSFQAGLLAAYESAAGLRPDSRAAFLSGRATGARHDESQ